MPSNPVRVGISDPVRIVNGSELEVNLASPVNPAAVVDIQAGLARSSDVVSQIAGTAYYVSTTGNDVNSGLDWDNALLSVQAAIDKCVSGVGDAILVGPGTFDESSNGAPGVTLNKSHVFLLGVNPNPNATSLINTDTTDGGSSITITASSCTIEGLTFKKGETTSNNARIVSVSGLFNIFLDDTIIVDNKASFTGLYIAGGLGIGSGTVLESKELGVSIFGFGVGTGLHVDGTVNVGIFGAQIGLVNTGALIDTGSSIVVFKTGITFQNCVSVGVQINAGATLSSIGADFENCPVNILDNSGNATNSQAASNTSLFETVTRINQFLGETWYVDGANGKDTNSGLSILTALKTIGVAIAAVSAGDKITVKSGTYDENGLDLSKNSLQLIGEIGTKIVNTAGGATKCLTISGNNCLVSGIDFDEAGIVGVQITGDNSRVENSTVSNATTAFDVDGDSNTVRGGKANLVTGCGFDIAGNSNEIRDSFATGSGGSSRGYCISGAAATLNRVKSCDSIGNAAAGFEAVTGTFENAIIDCTSAGGDGKRIDNGIDNSWANFLDQLDTERHEEILPRSTGQGDSGAAITVSNATTDDAGGSRDDQNYWGDVVVIVAPDTLTDFWWSNGLSIQAITTGKDLQWEAFFTKNTAVADQNGGNAWDLGETVLTVTDGSLFQNGDLVWITGDDRPNGEVLLVSGAPVGNVVTIASETRASAGTGIRYDYSITPANNKMYLVTSADGSFSSMEGDFAASSARDFVREQWNLRRRIEANGGMLIRVLNGDDNLPASFAVRAIIQD